MLRSEIVITVVSTDHEKKKTKNIKIRFYLHALDYRYYSLHTNNDKNEVLFIILRSNNKSLNKNATNAVIQV